MSLMTSLNRTDDDHIAVLFETNYAALVRLAAVLVDDVGSCEEIVQDAFARLLTTSPGPAPGKEASYLRSAVLNGARSRLRHRLVRERHEDPPTPPFPAAEQEAVRRMETRRVLDALRALPARQAEVLALRFQADLSEAEIAETLGISTGSVKTHAYRGIASLRDRLGETP
jgi:RNA polymerase sigma factor (sigma-70 family)